MIPVVVIIDASPLVVTTIEPGLRQAGYEVVHFQDPREALRTLFVTQEIPFLDLLLVGVRLPYIDGYEVIRQLRRHPEYELLPIIAIFSERGSLLDRFKARRAGANAYLQKPRVQELVALVQQLL